VRKSSCEFVGEMRLAVADPRVLYSGVNVGDRQQIQIEAEPIETKTAHREVETLSLRRVTDSVLMDKGLAFPESDIKTTSVRKLLKAECNLDKVCRYRTSIVSAGSDY
jgi:hypothetical protein